MSECPVHVDLSVFDFTACYACLKNRRRLVKGSRHPRSRSSGSTSDHESSRGGWHAIGITPDPEDAWVQDMRGVRYLIDLGDMRGELSV
jgi:hypothetical protein